MAFGDSLTSGVGASKSTSYPSVLAKLLNVKVVNEGISGEVSARGLARLGDILDKHSPSLLILLHGGNDLLRRLSEKTLIANLNAMIKLAQSKNIKVILIGVPKPGVFLKTASFYKKVAKNNKVLYLEDNFTDIFLKKKFKSDSIHLNEKGYKKLAESIATYIKVL